MPEVEALIFDLDGVLVDTIDLHCRAWGALAQQHNIPFTEDDIEYSRGLHRRDFIAHLFAPRTLTKAEINHYANTKQQHFLDILQHTSPDQLILPGVREFLINARELGYKIGVASSSVNAVFTLQYTGLHDLVEIIADGNTVSRSKPHPDIFVWVAGALRVRPQHVMVFEDAAVGIQAAHTAGMYVVGVGKNPAVYHADQTISNLLPEYLPTILENVSLGHIASHSA